MFLCELPAECGCQPDYSPLTFKVEEFRDVEHACRDTEVNKKNHEKHLLESFRFQVSGSTFFF